MKSFKVFAALFTLLLFLGAYAWFGIIKVEEREKKEVVTLFPDSFPDSVTRLDLTTDLYEVRIEKRDGVWWVTQPQEYLANQEYIEKAFRIMDETTSSHHFTYEEDKFGLEPGKAFYGLQFADGLEKRVKVGTKEGPVETIYLLDKDSNEIFVVHNVWAQFLYYPLSQFYHPGLPIPGAIVKSLSLKNQTAVAWSVEPAQNNMVTFRLKDQSKDIHKANGLWFFKKVREFQLEDLKFGEPDSFKPHWFLEIQTDKGNITFEFDEKMQKIRVPSFKIFAKVNPYSLKSLGYEIEKVFKSDQK